MRKASIPFVTVLVALAASLQPAAADDQTYVTGPMGQFVGYTVPVIVVSEGDTVTFTNLDIEPHDVVARDDQEGEPDSWCAEAGLNPCPLFWTPLIGLTQSTQVYGMDNVQSGGVYDFYCTIHAPMEGLMIVL